MTIALTTVLIYAKDMQRTARFYVEHFGYASDCKVVDGLISLQPLHGGAEILIHLASDYAFANTKDPDGNSISVSSRQYRTI